jgi:hypothetical protein
VPDWLRALLRPREGWLSWVFLFVMLLSLGWSVQSAAWIPQHDFVVPVAFWGSLAGAVLGITRWRVLVTLPLAALAGAGVVLWAVGGEYFTPLDQVARLFALRGEAITFTRLVIDAAVPTQLSPYAIGLGALVWVTAFIAAYTIYRHHRVMDAILLVGVTMAINMSASYISFLFIVPFSLAALLLWLRNALIGREETWKLRHVLESTDVHGSMLRSGLGFIFGTIALAWILTTVAVAAPLTGVWGSLDGAWSELRDDFSNLVGGLDPQPGTRIPAGQGFGTSLAVKGSWFSRDTEVMTVASHKAYYLRTVTYDIYTGHGWTSSALRGRNVAAGGRTFPGYTPERPVSEDPKAFHTETVAIEIQHSVGRNVFTPGFPTVALLPLVVREPGGKPMLGALESAVVLETGRGYQITALISDATEAMLAGAGTAYPPEIISTYLGTPGVTQRTKERARSIVEAAHATDPYHEAAALAAYLHNGSHFRYATTAPLPSDPNRDLVDFFLFDQQGGVGYCEYYATAMAVMARSIGLPARVAVGYAPGELSKPGIYQVRERNAHAWAEIYFPGYGWQIFEATKSIPGIPRAAGSGIVAPVVTQIDPGSRQVGPDEGNLGQVNSLPSFAPVPGGYVAGQQPPTDEARGGAALVFAVIFGALALYAAWRLFRRGRTFRFMAPGDRQWQRLAFAASRAGVSRSPSETIYEYATWLEDELPTRRPEIRTIADGKVWQSYSGRSMSSEAIARLERALERLRIPLIRLAIRRRVDALFPRRSRR